MYLPLLKAPYDTPLIFESVIDAPLSERFARLGIHRGDTVTRLSQQADAYPVRVRAAGREVVLASGMASKVITHHDDGHKTPISEMEPGETGHVEGLVCGSVLEKGLARLGIRENDDIEMIRRIPPMDYLVIMDGRRVVLPEGAAAKIIGLCRGCEKQFAVADHGCEFRVTELIGGRYATRMLRNMGIREGVVLTLESVRPASSEGCLLQNQTVLTTKSGLRLYLRQDVEARVMVSAGEAGGGAGQEE